MAQQGEALQDDARAADKMNQALHGAVVPDRGGRRGSRGRLPAQASDTARERSSGRRGRARRSARAEVRGAKGGAKIGGGPVMGAEEGAVIGGIEPRTGEVAMPETKKSSYDAIDEVLGEKK